MNPEGVLQCDLSVSEEVLNEPRKCGKVGQSAGEQHAREFLDACLHLSEIPDHPVAAHDIDLFHTVAIVRVPRAYSFGFGDNPVDICFVEDLDHLNFRELPPGTTLARLDGIDRLPLMATYCAPRVH